MTALGQNVTIKSVAGFDEKRGDTIKIAILDMPKPAEITPAEGMSFIGRNAPLLINGLIILLVTAAVIMMGVRPIIKAVNSSPAPMLPSMAEEVPALADGTGEASSGMDFAPGSSPPDDGFALDRAHHPPLIEMRDRLKRVLESDEDTAVSIMKEWLARGKAA